MSARLEAQEDQRRASNFNEYLIKGYTMTHLKAVSIMSILIIISSMGCTKKTTKLETRAEVPIVEKQEQTIQQEEYIPSDEDSFIEQDMDERMKEVLIPVYFDFDRYDLHPDAINTLENIARLLMDAEDIRVLAEGHCDERGSSEYNIGLGENRARSVRDWLTSYGISENRLEITSYGKEMPAFSNCHDEECHSQNRRVIWKILSKGISSSS